MKLEQARKLLMDEDQSHVLRFWEQLNDEERGQLLAQIGTTDFGQVREMQKLLRQHLSDTPVMASAPEPADVIEMDADLRSAATLRGQSALRAGEVGVLLVAGGQGSRLGFDGPKGAYPIGPVSQSILFHFHARKVLSLSRTYDQVVPFYIMTSETNHVATQTCFEEHNWFGLNPEAVFFFQQGMWPALDEDGKLILDGPGHLFMSPDGHGGTLSALRESGALQDMVSRGLKTIFYFQVDNPLVEVADPAFIGLHLLKDADLSIKVCAKRDPQEGLGMVVKRDGRHEIVEYTEFTEQQKNQRRADGELYFKFGSVAIHVFQLDFLQREIEAGLPLHIAHKKIAICDENGETESPAQPNGYKFEKFIFDLVPHADQVVNVAFDRAEEFSPVKNPDGVDSPATCKRDLSFKWARWLDQCAITIPRDDNGFPLLPIEIDPHYALNPAQLKERLSFESHLDLQQALWLKES